MTYVLSWTESSKGTISLDPREIDNTSTAITLFGKGAPNYGQEQQKNFLKLLENFSSPTAPTHPTTGLLWYNSSTNILNIRTSSNTWRKILDEVSGVASFNSRVGAVTLTSLDVTNALGFVPVQTDGDLVAIAGLSGTGFLKRTGTNAWMLDTTTYLTALTGVGSFNTRTGAVTLNSADVTGALGFTPPSNVGGGASGTWAINISGTAANATNAVNSTNATYLSATQQLNTIVGGQRSMAMVLNDATNSGSFVARASGNGDANLAGMSFHNDAYAIRMGVRADGYFGIGGWSRTAWSWYSDPSGNMVAAGNVSAYSDPRLKENFTTITNAMNIIQALDGGTFTWKSGIEHTSAKAGKKDYGILADQVETVMPEIVTDSIALDGQSYKTVAYDKIIPVLIEAIKEQQNQIEKLKIEVEWLSNKVEM